MPEPKSDWNSFARVNASQRWRKASAAMGRAMTDTIVAAAEVVPHLRVLDVASGTGEPAISIASALNGTGMVTATDISGEPLKVGEARAQERKLTNIRFRVADVHALPFPDESFERVTSRLGVMFFADSAGALREIHRVLTKDGRVALLAWGPMQQPYFAATIGTVLRVVPELSIPAGAAKMFRFGAPGTLGTALREAGFQDIDERQCAVAWNWPGTPEELWGYFQEVTVPFKPLLEAIPDESLAAVNEAVLRELRSRFDGEFVRFDAEVILATASR